MADVIVLVVIVLVVVLLLLMVLPRGREHARMAGCQSNLGHIGYAIAVFDAVEGRLPEVTGLAAPEGVREAKPPSVLREVLETLKQPDFVVFKDAITRPEPQPGNVPGELAVRGLICASDPNATAGHFTAPNSYRACTGDNAAGDNGAFAPAAKMSLKEIQDRDGTSYTALFSERLVGDNRPKSAVSVNYTLVAGHIDGDQCPGEDDLARWRGDAGSTWSGSDYRSTLYNHALTPNRQPSCVEASGKRALMGVSSGHAAGVNVLYADGHVATVTPTIDKVIWREFARIRARD